MLDRYVNPVTGDYIPAPGGAWREDDPALNRIALSCTVPLGQWEGDPGIGHRLGDLARLGDTAETRREIGARIEEALRWLLDDGTLARVETVVESIGRGRAVFSVIAHAPGRPLPLQAGPFFVDVGGGS